MSSSTLAIQSLTEIFPSVDKDVIVNIYHQCNGNSELAAVALLQIVDDSFSDEVFPTRPDEFHQVQRDEALARSLQRQIVHESLGFTTPDTPEVTQAVRERLPGTSLGPKLSAIGQATKRFFKRIALSFRSNYQRVSDSHDDDDEGIPLTPMTGHQPDVDVRPQVPTMRRRRGSDIDDSFGEQPFRL
ncbi:hypothetical protein GEMRC1_005114 [Eukaryota sp. GEM-RC1]